MCLKEKPMGLLDGKTAIVTGGGTGIGLAIARRFHGEGAKVVICGRRMEKLLESSQRISSRGEGVYAVKADVTVEDDLKRIVEETVKFTGRIDILVNNAGRSFPLGHRAENERPGSVAFDGGCLARDAESGRRLHYQHVLARGHQGLSRSWNLRNLQGGPH
jgi:NAD(P)-dependent dehydrogenase (short-subunit alcohol dehydrogenase family)